MIILELQNSKEHANLNIFNIVDNYNSTNGFVDDKVTSLFNIASLALKNCLGLIPVVKGFELVTKFVIIVSLFYLKLNFVFVSICKDNPYYHCYQHLNPNIVSIMKHKYTAKSYRNVAYLDQTRRKSDNDKHRSDE